MPRKKIHFGVDEFPDGTEPVFTFLDFKCWRFKPSFVERSGFGHETGFDVYIAGSLSRPDGKMERIEMIACFDRVSERRYRKVRFFRMEGRSSGECLLYLNHFILHYLVRHCRLTIEKTGLREVISP